MRPFITRLHTLFTAILLLSLSACGGGFGSSEQTSDPAVQDFPIVYVKRPLPFNDKGEPATEDARVPLDFHPGAILILKDRASPNATSRDISSAAFASAGSAYDVKDVSVSFDGQRIIFAMRAPNIEGADDNEQPSWNIWEYQLITNTLRRIITSDTLAEGGDDIAPAYLPDGRIVFSSTRQRRAKAILLDEGKPQFEALDENRRNPALSLHIMDDDGSNIQQITFNQSSDLDPTVLDNGKILFTRWDHYGNRNAMNLYQINPDGTHLEYIYGMNSHKTGSNNSTVQFLKPVALPDGQIMVSLRDYQSTLYGSDIIAIDTANFTDNNQPTYANLGAVNTAQTSLSFGDIKTDATRSPGGLINSAYPVNDGTGRLLLSWSQCRLIKKSDTSATVSSNTAIFPCTEPRLSDAQYTSARPLYGLWIFDPVTKTQLPIVPPQESFMYTDEAVLKSRSLPPILADSSDESTESTQLKNKNMGIVSIRSVYDMDGVDSTPKGITAMADPLQTPPDQRPARFLRIIKAVSLADRTVIKTPGTAFGVSSGQRMKEILGYVPIEPDGSVKFKVPANVAFTLSILDKDGQRTSERHQNWLQVQAGETLKCVGCHDSKSQLPHGRIEAQAPSVNPGAPTTGIPFPNTDAALFTNIGESMAETFARINGTRSLSPDLIYKDEWSATNKAADINYLYADLTTAKPISTSCATEWTGLCRIVINYEKNIHPLWNKDRKILDTDGTTVLSNNTCTRCHNTEDELGTLQIPAAQLDLSDGPSTDQAKHFKAYRELLANDNEQEINDAGILVDVQKPVVDKNNNPVFLKDDKGELILDAAGQPIQATQTVRVARSMSTNGALSSKRFFDLFNSGGSHENRLTGSELKLLKEWLDIGGQYYNNPFDVPQD